MSAVEWTDQTQTAEAQAVRLGVPGLSRMPGWLRRPVPRGPRVNRVRRAVNEWNLHTVCESAGCPNRLECYGRAMLTFLILGNVCTRNCAYCKVTTGKPAPLDPSEPQRVANAAIELGLTYVVITSVSRDDLPDGGADHFAETIRALRRLNPDIRTEVLIPDFNGSSTALDAVLDSLPTVLNHNLETVPRLYPSLRPQGGYERGIELLKRAKTLAPSIPTKSGLMLGLGERKEEVIAVLQRLRSARCDSVTLGQYVRPSLMHHPVERYLTPDEFFELGAIARAMGFAHIAAGPLVRRSYMADQAVRDKRDTTNSLPPLE